MKTDIGGKRVPRRGSLKTWSLKKMFVPNVRILGRQSWVWDHWFLNFFEFGGLFSNWCKRRQRHNFTSMVKRFKDPVWKTLDFVQPFLLTNEESEAQEGEGFGGFLFCFSEDLRCGSVRQGTGPGSTSFPETQPWTLSTSYKHSSLWTWSSFWKKREIGKCPFKTKLQSAQPHPLGRLP